MIDVLNRHNMLSRKEVVSRLKKTITKLNNLDDSKFNYGSFVEEFNDKRSCGTVCCVAGWYPKWFPEAKLIWVKKGDHLSGGKGFYKGTGNEAIIKRLCNYHGLSERAIRSLFFGESLYEFHLGSLRTTTVHIRGVEYKMSEVTPGVAMQRFEKMLKIVQEQYDRIEEEKLNPLSEELL